MESNTPPDGMLTGLYNEEYKSGWDVNGVYNEKYKSGWDVNGVYNEKYKSGYFKKSVE